MNDTIVKLINELKSEIANEVIQHIISHLEVKNNVAKEFYTLEEVSSITGLSIRQIKYRYKIGKMNPVYDGTQPLIPTVELDRYLNRLRIQI
jgi:predicted RNA-binding protein with RPS1 domain